MIYRGGDWTSDRAVVVRMTIHRCTTWKMRGEWQSTVLPLLPSIAFFPTWDTGSRSGTHEHEQTSWQSYCTNQIHRPYHNRRARSTGEEVIIMSYSLTLFLHACMWKACPRKDPLYSAIKGGGMGKLQVTQYRRTNLADGSPLFLFHRSSLILVVQVSWILLSPANYA